MKSLIQNTCTSMIFQLLISLVLLRATTAIGVETSSPNTVSRDSLAMLDNMLDRDRTDPDFDIGQILDPYKDRGEGNNTCNVTSTIQYRDSVLVRVVYIPALIILFLSSILLLYILLTLLKPLIKIYLSVLFYSVCQVLLAACLLLSLLSSHLFTPSPTSCSITEPLYSVAMILPGYAVLVITIVRFIFLSCPMTWRNLLRMPYQIAGFTMLVVLAVVLANLPNFGLCSYTLDEDLSQCRYGSSGLACDVFYSLYILIGFLFPCLGVLILYCLIYRIISRHRAHLASTTSRSRRTSSTRLTSSTTDQQQEKGNSSRSETERSQIPWSIIVILVLNLLSTLPWIPQSLYPDLFYGCQPGEIVLTVDLLWTLLIVSVSLSPAAYLLSTQSVREHLVTWFSCCVRTDKQFQRLSNV